MPSQILTHAHSALIASGVLASFTALVRNPDDALRRTFPYLAVVQFGYAFLCLDSSGGGGRKSRSQSGKKKKKPAGIKEAVGRKYRDKLGVRKKPPPQENSLPSRSMAARTDDFSFFLFFFFVTIVDVRRPGHLLDRRHAGAIPRHGPVRRARDVARRAHAPVRRARRARGRVSARLRARRRRGKVEAGPRRRGADRRGFRRGDWSARGCVGWGRAHSAWWGLSLSLFFFFFFFEGLLMVMNGTGY